MEVQPSVSPQQSECNPVGALQELVVQKGWRLPEYTVTQESGPAHRKEFTMTCRVERFVEIGNWMRGSCCSCCPQHSSPGHRQPLASLPQPLLSCRDPPSSTPSFFLAPHPTHCLLADQVLGCRAGPELSFAIDIP